MRWLGGSLLPHPLWVPHWAREGGARHSVPGSAPGSTESLRPGPRFPPLSVRGEGQGPAGRAPGRVSGEGGWREGAPVACWVPVGSRGRTIAGPGYVLSPRLTAWPAAGAGGRFAVRAGSPGPGAAPGPPGGGAQGVSEALSPPTHQTHSSCLCLQSAPLAAALTCGCLEQSRWRRAGGFGGGSVRKDEEV